jgi:hypothetical protein
MLENVPIEMVLDGLTDFELPEKRSKAQNAWKWICEDFVLRPWLAGADW